MEKSVRPRLTDIVEAIELIQAELADTDLHKFSDNRRQRWIIERGLEIVSEASRHLSEAVKARHADIPWRKVAGIGNILRHEYNDVSPRIMWQLVRHDLPPLLAACQEEVSREL